MRNVQPQLYPTLDAPALSQYGGPVTSAQQIELTVPPGASVYYTLDSSDPRLEGGVLNPTAQLYASPFTLTGPTCSVLARAFNGTQWSALERGNFAVDVSVRINELQSSNQNTILDEAGQSEDWMELINPSSSSVDISGWGLSDDPANPDRKSTRLNSSHVVTSYAVFCLKKKKNKLHTTRPPLSTLMLYTQQT